MTSIESILEPPAESTIDPSELAHYESAADLWWDTSTVAKWLHKYNTVRVPYIRDAICRRFGRDFRQPDCLKDLRILDIGCGGGVLCEPLAQLGAAVTGVDPAGTAIGVANRHAQEANIIVDYRCDTIEALARAGEQFDVVLTMEVVEHVAHVGNFLDKCASLVQPGGLLILSTINRTWKSYVFAIVMGEYILRLLPRGARPMAEICAARRDRGVIETKSVPRGRRERRHHESPFATPATLE